MSKNLIFSGFPCENLCKNTNCRQKRSLGNLFRGQSREMFRLLCLFIYVLSVLDIRRRRSPLTILIYVNWRCLDFRQMIAIPFAARARRTPRRAHGTTARARRASRSPVVRSGDTEARRRTGATRRNERTARGPRSPGPRTATCFSLSPRLRHLSLSLCFSLCI